MLLLGFSSEFEMYNNPQHSRKELELAEALVRAALHLHTRQKDEDVTPPAARAFVTISRQAGAAGRPLAQELVKRLNESVGASWAAWDQELVEKVSSEHHIEAALVDLMEDRRHSWFQEFLENLVNSNAHPDEVKIYRRVATTIRALAARGHAVIVGRGGSFITAGLPGGIHVRLVSPLAHRIARLSQDDDVPLKQAAATIAQIDHTREAFYHRFWPRKPLAPESFTMTLNTAEMSLGEIVECVVAVIRFREQNVGTPGVRMTVTGGASLGVSEIDRSRAG